jgi:hypothetical protein
MMRRLVTVLVLTLLTGGCGGAGSGDSSTWVTSPAPPTTSPTPGAVALTLAQAGPRYLQIVKPYNTALERFEDAAQANTPWRSLRPLAAKVAQANAAHAKALRETRWPIGVRAPMAKLLAETDLAQRDWERAAAAKTADDLAQAVRSAVRHNGSKPAGQIRTLLGLPAYSE